MAGSVSGDVRRGFFSSEQSSHRVASCLDLAYQLQLLQHTKFSCCSYAAKFLSDAYGIGDAKFEFEQRNQDCITCSARSLRVRAVAVTSCWKAVAVFAHGVCKSQSRVVLVTGPQV